MKGRGFCFGIERDKESERGNLQRETGQELSLKGAAAAALCSAHWGRFVTQPTVQSPQQQVQRCSLEQYTTTEERRLFEKGKTRGFNPAHVATMSATSKDCEAGPDGQRRPTRPLLRTIVRRTSESARGDAQGSHSVTNIQGRRESETSEAPLSCKISGQQLPLVDTLIRVFPV